MKHIFPNVWQRALLGEGALAVAIVLVLADLASAWTLLVLPLAVAAVVKAHDLLAGYLQRPPKPPKPPRKRRARSNRQSTDPAGRTEPESASTGRTKRSRRRGAAGPATSDEPPADWPADADGTGPQQGRAPSWRRKS